MSKDGRKQAVQHELAELDERESLAPLPNRKKNTVDSLKARDNAQRLATLKATLGRNLLKLQKPPDRVPVENSTSDLVTAHADARKISEPRRPQVSTLIPQEPNRSIEGVGIIVRDVPLPAPPARGRFQASAITEKEEAPAQRARRRLDDTSADVSRLSIRMAVQAFPMLRLAESKTVQNPAFFQKLKRFTRLAAPKLEPSPAIIGFDFGTAFTKVVIQWQARHYAVPWRDGADDCQRFLLPSIVFVGSDGCASLDRGKRANSSLIDGIKGRLLTLSEGELASNPDVAIDAVLFMASALRHAMTWFKGIATNQGGDVSIWRLNIGLPAEPWQDEPLRDGLRLIGTSALSLADGATDITRTSARQALQEAQGVSRPVAVVAEFAAQLASYMKGPQRQNDLHMLIDVGAGTVDFVAFNSHVTEDSEVLPLAGAAVERLGAHYLLAALAGRSGQSREWEDSNSTESDDYFARCNREESAEVAQRRDVFDRVFRNAMGRLGNEAHQWYPQSDKFRSGSRSRIPVFLCGGGSHIEQFREMVLRYTGFRVELRPLPMPGAIEGFSDEAAFHRLSVAYGLSLNSRNLAQVWKRELDTTLRARRVVDFGDRDADR